MAIPKQVNFPSRGLNISGALYQPPTGALNRKNAAIVVGHPISGVKEQTAGLHASLLADQGFTVLAFDAAYQGESEGSPHGLEDPYQRVEDLKSAVTFLATQDRNTIDPERIGVLGICGSGGYAPFAAQTDLRMKAVATVSGVCYGELIRHGINGYPAAGLVTPEQLAERLKQSGEERIRYAKGSEAGTFPILPETADALPKDFPLDGMWHEAIDYYKTDRAHNPRSDSKQVLWSVDLAANYDSYAFNHMISPRPLLMIVGSNADTAYFSEDAIKKAKEPKELFAVPGQTHVGLYDHTSESLPKLVDFFSNALAS